MKSEKDYNVCEVYSVEDRVTIQVKYIYMTYIHQFSCELIAV